jgi:hypothetical protein
MKEGAGTVIGRMIPSDHFDVLVGVRKSAERYDPVGGSFPA